MNEDKQTETRDVKQAHRKLGITSVVIGAPLAVVSTILYIASASANDLSGLVTPFLLWPLIVAGLMLLAVGAASLRFSKRAAQQSTPDKSPEQSSDNSNNY